ncbi:hypothetical protein KDM87_03620 [Undibacterium sp. FT147W]|uniref:Uncharacterized protein n=1 Tax=Undibacterium rivi TaxID=2828729 RepID=A0ABS5GYX6_9BURK|nr:hypothetical protein [Undibacterium rivi]MBR7791671.1 hypothetical protein [Undibacterium rivi]
MLLNENILMATARDKVQQLGFWDDEVKNVSHDKIVLWVHANAEMLARKYIKEFLPDYHHDVLQANWTSSELRIPAGEKLINLPLPPEKPTNLVYRVTLEKVIQQHSENGRILPRILGYADALISWSTPSAVWDVQDKCWQITGSQYSILVEVKSTLPSLGELMRQINLYRLVYRDVIVVAPDDSLSPILKDQKVMFVKHNEKFE